MGYVLLHLQLVFLSIDTMFLLFLYSLSSSLYVNTVGAVLYYLRPEVLRSVVFVGSLVGLFVRYRSASG